MFKPAKPSPFQRIALVGPSGSGKTWTSLKLAATQGKLLLISLEEGGDLPDVSCDFCFVGGLASLKKGLEQAAGRYPVVVIDCLSSLWQGSSGLLGHLDRLDDKRGWALIRQELEELWAAIHRYPGHILATFRAEEVRVQVEREGQPRILSLCGKTAFASDYAHHFQVLFELGGGVADCKKGPPSLHGRLLGKVALEEIAGPLFPPISAPQTSPPAAEIASPQEAAPETTSHPLGTGTGTQSSAPKETGQSEKPASNEVITVTRLRSAANAALKAGVKRGEIDRVLKYYEGQFAENGALTGMPPRLREMALGELAELTLKAEAAAETPWGQG